jgi:transcriptional antiterminator RfaH
MSMLCLDETPCWYVIRTNPKQEERAYSNLRSWRVETFAPKLKKLRCNRSTGEAYYSMIPLFPGYIFARFALNSLLHKIKFTRGVQSIVSFGGRPTLVDDEIISLIQSRVGQDGYIRMGDQLEPGDEVMIKDGPLKNISGVFEQGAKDADRVTIMLNVISYQARVTIDRELIQKAG